MVTTGFLMVLWMVTTGFLTVIVNGYNWFLDCLVYDFLGDNSGLVWFRVFLWCKFVEKFVDEFLCWFRHFLGCVMSGFDDFLGCVNDLVGSLVECLVSCLVMNWCLYNGFGNHSLCDNWFRCQLDVGHWFRSWLRLLVVDLCWKNCLVVDLGSWFCLFCGG